MRTVHTQGSDREQSRDRRLAPYPTHTGPAIQRLLFVADAAVADVGQLPPPVRAVIDAAGAVFVLTPTLPGRLAWLADEVDEVRHVADERLDTVLGHMHSIGAHASGAAIRGSVLTVIADAVAEFKPDHILLALRSAEHANWQERGLVEHIEQRFGLPVTTYAVDPRGHASSAHGPLLLCFDGSEDARRAIERAGALFAGRRALVVTVWQPIADLNSFAWTGPTASRGRPRRAQSRRCRGRSPHCRRRRPRRAGGGPQGRAVRRRDDRSGVEDDRGDR